MHSITLSRVIPGPMASGHKAASGIWLQDELTFTRPGVWLIDAPSGTGKSSLCNILYCARRDYAGRVLFDGTDAATLTPAQITALRRCHLAYLPQELRLFPELTVMENIELKNRLTSFKTRDQILGMLDALGIDGYAGRSTGTLSWGQRQRVALVRALCQPFDFLLLDEPVSHLDEANNRAAAALVSAEARAQGAGVIITSVGNPMLVTPTATLPL